jgi:hypothetical protein
MPVESAPAAVLTAAITEATTPTNSPHVAAAAQQAAVAAPAPVVQAPPAPVQPATVTIPLEQLQTFTSIQARLAQMESEQRSRDEAARAEQVKLLAQKGEIEKALQVQREEAQKQLDSERANRASVEERSKRYALDGEVSRVLASQPLVPGGAEQLTQLWRNQFVVEAQGDGYAVRTPTYQSVADFVSSQLARPEYAHFVRPSTTGGVGAQTGAQQTVATPAANAAPAASATPTFANFGEAAVYQTLHNRKTTADPRVTSGWADGKKQELGGFLKGFRTA